MFAYSALRQPIYYPRYLGFTTPAMALLIGFCVVVAIRSRVGITVAVLASPAPPCRITSPSVVRTQRRHGLAATSQTSSHAMPHPAIAWSDNSAAWKPGPIRPMLAARPAAFAKLHDYGRGRSSIDRDMLWDGHTAIWMWADKLPGCTTLWTVSERDATLPDHQQGPDLGPGPRLARAMAFQVPSRFGFHVVERWQFSFAQVVKSTGRHTTTKAGQMRTDGTNEHQVVQLSDGRALCFAQYGAPDGFPVINAHGGLACRLDVAAADSISREAGVRLISPDRPGIGGSDPKPGRTILDWADDIRGIHCATGGRIVLRHGLVNGRTVRGSRRPRSGLADTTRRHNRGRPTVDRTRVFAGLPAFDRYTRGGHSTRRCWRARALARWPSRHALLPVGMAAWLRAS